MAWGQAGVPLHVLKTALCLTGMPEAYMPMPCMDARMVLSYWIYFLARWPTTQGSVGWGISGCDRKDIARSALRPASLMAHARAGKAN